MYGASMDTTADQRRQLGAFIRSRREAIEPVRTGTRRRTPGLRREEVALACGISTTWYTWIEQGRDISISPSSLARLSKALHCTPAERSYLFELTRKRDPAAPLANGLPDGRTPDDIPAVLQAIAAPAYLLDRYWRIAGCNAAARHLLSPWLDGGESCLLGFVFLDPAARGFICDWEERARRLLAEFRADTAHHLDDPAMRSLIEKLQGASPLFARFWSDQAVLAREGGQRRFNHPDDGLLSHTQVTLVPANHPDHKIIILLPAHPVA